MEHGPAPGRADMKVAVMSERGGMYKRGILLLPVLGLGVGVLSHAGSANAEPAQQVATTSPAPTGPVPAPAPAMEPSGLGTNGALDQLASACFNGSMQACDDLYETARQDPANVDTYTMYGDTCAGRQPRGTGLLCAEVFVDGPAMGQPAGPATTSAAPAQTTVTTIAEDVMFGVGAGTGQIIPACPPGSFADTYTTCAPSSTPIPMQTVQLRIDADCPIDGDLEHPNPNDESVFTFTEPAHMRTFLECILPEAVAWMEWEYGTLEVPDAWAGSQATSLLPNAFLYVPTGVRGPVSAEGCVGEDSQGEVRYNDQDLAYCPVDGFIYFGEQAVWDAYNRYGDADAWGTIAHEWGHRIQQVAGLLPSATDNEQIAFENQADCFSGALLDFSGRHTARDAPSTPDDIQDLFDGLFDIGDPRIGLDTQNHGTVDQRIRAFFVGYNSSDSEGAWACDFFVTSGSIIPPGSGGSSTAPTTTVAG